MRHLLGTTYSSGVDDDDDTSSSGSSNSSSWGDDYDSHAHKLIYAHAACMGLAFGLMFPIGAFLAYTGHHKIHIPIQLTSLAIAVTGFILIVTSIESRGGSHFDNPHSVAGLIILIAAFFLQPVAIYFRQREVHHKNGSFVVLSGMMNVFLGMLLAGLASIYQAFYTVIFLSHLINFIFDPLQLRQKRMIEIAKMKAKGQDIEVQWKDAVFQGRRAARHNIEFDRHAHLRRTAWEKQLDQGGQMVHFLGPGTIKEDEA